MRVLFKAYKGKTHLENIASFDADAQKLLEDHIKRIVKVVRPYPPGAHMRSRRLYRGWRYGVRRTLGGYVGWITNVEPYATYVHGVNQSSAARSQGWKRLDQNLQRDAFSKSLQEFRKVHFRLR